MLEDAEVCKDFRFLGTRMAAKGAKLDPFCRDEPAPRPQSQYYLLFWLSHGRMGELTHAGGVDLS